MRETAQSLREKGICPTCYHREHGGIFGDDEKTMLCENDRYYCVLEGSPRARGHTIIISKTHYHDMSQIPDDLCAEMFVFAKKAMNALREALGVERVYLCTMCDGPVNHFHLQLIPRHPGIAQGSRNFVTERGEYIHDEALLARLRALLSRPDEAETPLERK